MRSQTRNQPFHHDNSHHRRTAPFLAPSFLVLLCLTFAAVPALADDAYAKGGQDGDGYALAEGTADTGGYALVDRDGRRDRGRHDRDRGRRDWDRGRDRDRHHGGHYDRDRHHDRYDHYRGGYRGPQYRPNHYRPRHFTVPRVLIRTDLHHYRDYYYGRVYHAAHHHYHDVYRFPVYADYGVEHYPYAYCGEKYFGRGVFEYQGPRIGFQIRF